MSKNKPENPNAFPIPAGCWPNDEASGNSAQYGMNLRDYFAAYAMQAIIGKYSQMPVSESAEFAYKYADSMLAARENNN